jgi:GAF domain-containing protein
MGTASSTLSLSRLTLSACNRPQASQLSQDLSPAESEKNAHRHFQKWPIDLRLQCLGIKGAAKYTHARQDHRQHNTSSTRERSHVVFAEPPEDEARCSCKKSMVNPSPPSSLRSSLLSVMVSARATAAQLYDLGCAFAARLEMDQLIPFVVVKCREVLDAEGASVLLLDQERNELYFPYIAEENPEVAERLARLRFSAELGIAASALKTCATLRIEDAQTDPRFYHGIDKLTGLTTRNVLAAPLQSHQGMTGVV